MTASTVRSNRRDVVTVTVIWHNAHPNNQLVTQFVIHFISCLVPILSVEMETELGSRCRMFGMYLHLGVLVSNLRNVIMVTLCMEQTHTPIV